MTHTFVSVLASAVTVSVLLAAAENGLRLDIALRLRSTENIVSRASFSE